jgi:hypothetical protein
MTNTDNHHPPALIPENIRDMHKERQTEIHADQAILHLFYRDLQIEEIETVDLQALLETVQAELKYRIAPEPIKSRSNIHGHGTG